MSKISSYDLGAFQSPNFPPLVNGEYSYTSTFSSLNTRILVGIDIVVNIPALPPFIPKHTDSRSTGTMSFDKPVYGVLGLTKVIFHLMINWRPNHAFIHRDESACRSVPFLFNV